MCHIIGSLTLQLDATEQTDKHIEKEDTEPRDGCQHAPVLPPHVTLEGPSVPSKGKGFALQVIRLVNLYEWGNGLSHACQLRVVFIETAHSSAHQQLEPLPSV